MACLTALLQCNTPLNLEGKAKAGWALRPNTQHHKAKTKQGLTARRRGARSLSKHSLASTLSPCNSLSAWDSLGSKRPTVLRLDVYVDVYVCECEACLVKYSFATR
mmetsp:Transcript_28147/g.41384  ORF Transcript_28147/g.41384 Transcript_28147/m.41384 type:complete len:106 (-) Transcript_28147:1558-1875(-)